ncbi:protein LURP-one-related 15-like [Telopea speciosissima]|uniref:protein LURP-one-related 15-like n=1 Tax=Telopea speciosissima TaxID=54955 RepID=UPI001CC4CA89|nr:protein LURP-one-related 15-like [Telopea speciosissima]
MAEHSNNYPPLTNLITVVGPQFCAPYPVDLTIVRKVLSIGEGNFSVADVNGNIIFKVKNTLFSLHDRRVLLDANSNPLLSIRKKILSAHSRWEVFRGDSSDSNDLLFSAKRSSLFQFKTQLNVFLAGNNTNEEVCDFKIKGSWLERSCKIYVGDSSNLIAQMHKKHTVQSVLFGKDNFTVTAYPNVDHAFIVSLIVILNAINESANDTHTAGVSATAAIG